MIFTQGAKDEQNREERTKNVIDAIRTGRSICLMLEPASSCNLSCSFCDLHSRIDSMTKPKGIMSLELYKLIIDQIDDLDFRFGTVHFIGNGEPLLNKNLLDMISLAVEKGISRKYVCSTNGTLMNPDIFNGLMSSGLDEVAVSLDTLNRELYKKSKGKDLLPVVLDNIQYAINRVLQSPTPTISLVIKCASVGKNNICDLTDDDMHEIIDKYREVAADSQHVHIKVVPVVEVMNGLIRASSQRGQDRVENHAPCEMPFYMIYIQYDGTVSCCCSDVIDALKIGRIGPDHSLKDILRGPRLRRIREIHLSGNLDQIPLCKYCGNRTVVDLSDYRDELLALI